MLAMTTPSSCLQMFWAEIRRNVPPTRLDLREFGVGHGHVVARFCDSCRRRSSLLVRSADAGAVVHALLVKPGGDVVAPVAHATADPEAAGAVAEVAPVAQGGYGGADDRGDLADGEQLVACGRRVVGDSVVGHRGILRDVAGYLP